MPFHPPLQHHPDIFCGFLMPYNIGFVREDPSPPLHGYFQGEGCRQAARATRLLPLSSEAADRGNNALEKISWAHWHGGVRHPNVSLCPGSLNSPCGMGTGVLIHAAQ